MVTTRRSSLKRVEVVANAAVNEGQQQLNQDKTCSLPSLRRRPSGYARQGPPKKIKTQYGDDLADNSHLQLENADVRDCDRKFICFDTLESSEAVIPPKKPQHRQKTVIPDPKEFDKFHSSGELDLLVGPFKYELPAASNSSSMSISGSGATKNADSLNSVQGRVLSNCLLGNRPQKSAKEKKCDAELKAEFKKRGQQLEDYKRVLAVKEVEVEDLKKKVLDAERDFVTMKDMVTKVDKLKSENRAKLRHALNLGSLGHGLI